MLVTGATGNVGRAVVAALCRERIGVRAGVRDPAGATHALPGDVEVVHLDFDQPPTFRPALSGARGLLLVRPPAIARVGPTLHALIDAAGDAGVNHAVFVSVAGAGTNRIVPHHRVERHLRASTLAWTIVRPGFFAQNLGDAYREDVRDDDRLFVPAADGAVAFVDVRDVGDLAATVFREPSRHAGAAYTVTGPRAVTFAQLAQVLTVALDRPIRYEPATTVGYVRHLRSRGLPAARIAVQLLLHLGLRRGGAAVVDPTLPRLLGRPARTIETYVGDHRALWRSDVPTDGPA